MRTVLLLTAALALALPAGASANTYTVENTGGDAGAGSLRKAITDANNNAGPDTVNFAPTAYGTITLDAALPVFDNAQPLFLDGPGSSLVTIDNNGNAGPSVQGDASTIDDLTIIGASDHGIKVQGATVAAINNVVLQGNAEGVRIQGGASSVFVTDSVISGNSGAGIYVLNASGVDIKGNTIGTNALGADDANGLSGIQFESTTNSTIGGPGAADANEIGPNGQNGIALGKGAAGSSGNTVRGNFIGTDDAGTADRGNFQDGIFIGPGGDNDGNTVVNNTIAFNNGDGVRVGATPAEDSTGNPITGNRFFANSVLPIGFGLVAQPTANDEGDADAGANRGQNFPVLTGATADTTTGTLNSLPSREYTIEVYNGASCDQGERGRTPVTTLTVNTDAAGNAGFAIPAAVALGSGVSALATSSETGDTSQMGSCVIAAPPLPPATPTPSPEPVATASPVPTASPTPAPTTAPAPVPGKAVVVAPVKGTVKVKVPGGGFKELEAGQAIPVGSVVDTKKGRVELTAAQGGGTQTASFYAGQFKVGQAGGTTTLTLQGKVGPCGKAKGKASVAKKKKKRKLWGDGSGSYSTKGRYGSATVRGTKWLTEDTCKGTKVTVKKGVVAVKGLSGPSKGKTFTVAAGSSKLVKARK